MGTKKFPVTITEVLERTIEIKAETEEEALATAKKMYQEERVVLDYSDLQGTEYTVQNQE